MLKKGFSALICIVASIEVRLKLKETALLDGVA
jgi:hypothetical protein